MFLPTHRPPFAFHIWSHITHRPEDAASFAGRARLVIEGVPPLAVDDVDSLTLATLTGSAGAALKDVFGGKKKKKRRKRPRAARGVPESEKP